MLSLLFHVCSTFLVSVGVVSVCLRRAFVCAVFFFRFISVCGALVVCCVGMCVLLSVYALCMNV